MQVATFSWGASLLAVAIIAVLNYFTLANHNWIETGVATIIGTVSFQIAAWLMRRHPSYRALKPLVPIESTTPGTSIGCRD